MSKHSLTNDTALALVLLASIAAGCGGSSPIDEHDAGSDAATGSDASDGGYASCPAAVMVHDYAAGTYEPWGVGALGTCVAFGFEITTATRAAAEAAFGEPCAAAMCIIVAPKSDALTSEQLDRACAIEAALGPQFWVCKYE